jgi:serine/threonine-protein kinase
MIGKKISHYRIIEKLGEGGMGVIYKAQDLKLDRFVALKFLPPHLTTSIEEKQRFIHEAKAASSLDHPNICNIYEIDETEDGQLFISMAYYEGKTLDKPIKEKPLPLEEAINIAIQIAHGLAKAHEKEIVHRDIKPANIMLTREGVVKVLDFGLAKLSTQTKLTKESTTLGTVSYMSPEQAKGEEVDSKTDVWSLGVIIYEMLTGQLPFKGEYESAVIYSIMNDTQEPVTGLRTGVPMELERIINKCLQKKPADRYQHVDEMAVDLTAIKKKIESGETRKQVVETKVAGRKRLYLYPSLAGLLALIVLLVIYLWPEQRAPIDSIAVLPLDNLSGDSEQDYFVDGMTEVLTTELSKIEVLSVPSRTSAMRYKNTDKSLTEIAEELDVGALVEGSVMLVGNRVRITAQLIEAKTNRHLWADDYERDIRDVLSLQKEVAWAIASEIKVQLTPQDKARLGKAQAVDPEAYELYLRGRHLLNQRVREEGKVERALEYFEQAVAKDASYVPTYADIVLACVWLMVMDQMSMDVAGPKARFAASKAIELNDKLPEAHIAIGLFREWFELDWIGAEESFRRAIQLNPRSKEAHHEYGWLLLRLGRFDEAEAEFETHRTLEQIPFSWLSHRAFAELYYYSRQYDLGIDWCWKALELDSTRAFYYYFLSRVYLTKGNFQQAQIFRQKYDSLVGSSSVDWPGYFYAVTGKQEEALTVLDDLQKRWQQGNKRALLNIARIYTGLGEKQEALTWLERTYDERGLFELHFIKVNPQWDSLREEPRFKAMLKKMNFEVDE